MTMEVDSKPTNKELLAPKKNFLLVEFYWDKTIVLPYEDGIKFMESLRFMETYSSTHGEIKKILPVSSEEGPQVKTTILSQEEYLALKMNALLNVETREKNE